MCSRATFRCLAGRIWPANRTLPRPDLAEGQNHYQENHLKANHSYIGENKMKQTSTYLQRSFLVQLRKCFFILNFHSCSQIHHQRGFSLLICNRFIKGKCHKFRLTKKGLFLRHLLLLLILAQFLKTVGIPSKILSTQ
jgi:hypothetical protein